jgi:DNA transformation protein
LGADCRRTDALAAAIATDGTVRLPPTLALPPPPPLLPTTSRLRVRYPWRVMVVTREYLHYVLDQLAALGAVTSRRMFGGVGLYHDARFFGIIMSDTLYFKVNDANRLDYSTRGMKAFRPYADKPLLSMAYFEVPADILEDPEECAAWRNKSG